MLIENVTPSQIARLVPFVLAAKVDTEILEMPVGEARAEAFGLVIKRYDMKDNMEPRNWAPLDSQQPYNFNVTVINSFGHTSDHYCDLPVLWRQVENQIVVENTNDYLFRNHYYCDSCGDSWEDEWYCQCDDKCSTCGFYISPEESDDLHIGEPSLDEKKERLEAMGAKFSTVHGGQYYRVELEGEDGENFDDESEYEEALITNVYREVARSQLCKDLPLY